jgi:hypothetical protein
MVIRVIAVAMLAGLCGAAAAQQPKLILRAAFDGGIALEPGGKGELVAGQFVEGREGQAIKASEAGKHACTIPLRGVSPDEGTLMFWFRPDTATPAQEESGVRHSAIGVAEGAGPQISLQQAWNQARMGGNNPWSRQAPGPGAVYSHLIAGKWYHIAYTWKKDGNDLCVWFFGLPQSDTLGKWGAAVPGDEAWADMLQVGCSTGAVDDLRIYDRALTGEQIIAAGEYKDGEGMFDEGKIFYDTMLDTEALKGRLLVEETFDGPWERNWQLEGPGILTLEDGRLRMREGDNHIVLWNKQTFPKDFIAEWDFTPNEIAGLCIVFFCAAGRGGEDIFDPALAKREGTFKLYHSGDLNCYHISYFRNTSARSPNCALRKNWGFYRASCGYDFIPLETGSTSAMTLVKRGAHLQLAINGHVSIDWVDDGVTRGPVWGAGKIGLRQMMNTDAYYDNFRVWTVK